MYERVNRDRDYYYDNIVQRIPENRKLPYSASVYYFTYGQAEEG